MERWSVMLERQDCKFSCAHFLIFPDGSKERLHGHNYQFGCRVGGELGTGGLVMEFGQLKAVVRELCCEVDEHWLIPARHPELTWAEDDAGHLDVRYRDRRYRAPCDEVLVVPVDNISVENLAGWLGGQLRLRLGERHPEVRVDRLEVRVSEVPGQHGIFTWQAGGTDA